MKVYKKHDVRKKEIIDTAEALFIIKGYLNTSINDILKEINIARGTFYHYFKSKEDLLDAVVIRFVTSGVEDAKSIVKNNSLTVYEKFLGIIMAQKPTTPPKKEIANQLHTINNAEMHQRSLVEMTKQLTPVLVEVIDQGIAEGIFNTPYPKEAIEVILVSSLFIFDDDIFHWHPSEMASKVVPFIHIVETILGAKEGSFSFILPAFSNINIEEGTKNKHAIQNIKE